jgi:predicted enzyme related to lactoylglutathione lyase
MAASISRVILYVKDIPKVASFYQRHFGMKPIPSSHSGWLELTSGPEDCCNIALHQAATSQKSGAAMKIVFGVVDVKAFVRQKDREGLSFGPVHDAGEFEYANAKDPAGNSIQVSSRGLK